VRATETATGTGHNDYLVFKILGHNNLGQVVPD
jgi:hypothetical protein